MNQEIVESKLDLSTPINGNGKDMNTSASYPALSASFTDKAIQAMSDQRAALQRFIAGQLKNEIDYGIIPGTGTKPTLLKPGAEKLANLFRLGSRIVARNEYVEFEKNIASFTTAVEVYALNTNTALAQCEGICNSREKKYYMRAKYEYANGKREKVGTEETPIGDLLNTLKKMSIKRAYVGAVIMAVGASDFFTQDLEDMDLGGRPLQPKNKNTPMPNVKPNAQQNSPLSNSGNINDRTPNVANTITPPDPTQGTSAPIVEKTATEIQTHENIITAIGAKPYPFKGRLAGRSLGELNEEEIAQTIRFFTDGGAAEPRGNAAILVRDLNALQSARKASGGTFLENYPELDSSGQHV